MPTPDLTFTGSIPNDGGIALKDDLGNIIDQVGLDAGSAFFESTPLAPLVGNIDQSYERKLGGVFGSCQDSDNNIADFQLISPSDPQNTASPFTICAIACTTTTTTSTTTSTTTTTHCPPCLPYYNDWETFDLTNWTTVTGTFAFTGNDFGGGVAREAQFIFGPNQARWCDCLSSSHQTAVQATIFIPTTGPSGPSPAKNGALGFNSNPITGTFLNGFITVAPPGVSGIGAQYFNGVTFTTLTFLVIPSLTAATFYILRVEIGGISPARTITVSLFTTSMVLIGTAPTVVFGAGFPNGDQPCYGFGSSFSYFALTNFSIENLDPECIVPTTTTTTAPTTTTTTSTTTTTTEAPTTTTTTL